MTENIQQTFKARDEFIGHLEGDIKKNNEALKNTSKELGKLQSTITDIKTLGEYPEHTALIPLAKNIYMEGKILHTGECYVKKKASPESYIMLKSLNQTVSSLEDRVKSTMKDVEKMEYIRVQLEERLKLFKGDSDIMEVDESPKEIHSDKGVAVKVGEFYEIFEYED